ncbi:hypothetical protein ATO8_07401 [Roseivivax marinus]|uniref:Glycosyltransferase n=1 Tax=Roseivivax marinus TaxID=1379903 RepID=W4HKT4_9RHOB|nr:galactosyltransferase-related protein [Roseivivax marinus]ETW13018.1 hypothetical protein ATO8_07401 [Roseivivax marinus]
MKRISALTIAAGRADHLANVVRGLTEQRLCPDELVIGLMQDAPYDDLPDAPFEIRQVPVPDGAPALAGARNAAAHAATGDVLVFLDVDCIPHPELIADYAASVTAAPGVHMGEVMYLPQGATDGATENGIDWVRFDRLAERHPDRGKPPRWGRAACDDYRCFWSLNFAMSAADWRASGGFDERYRGYGGEDTDFGRTVAEQGQPIWWLKGAKVYHQHHAHCMPPIHHLRSVIRNADLFAEKWGHRTMEHWLYGFELMGLIEKRPEGIVVLREPGEEDFALCRQQTAPYATTRRVLDILQGIDPRTVDNRSRTREVHAAQSRLTDVAAE